MRDVEVVSGIIWHFECMNLSAAAIQSFRPPADGFQMRMHYSLFITNLMSSTDMMIDFYGEVFRSDLESQLHTPTSSGSEVLSYLRELRNGIVHRGVDPTSMGSVVNGVTCALAPSIVTGRRIVKNPNVRIYKAPSTFLWDIFGHCEAVTKLVAAKFLEPTLENIANVQESTLLSSALDAVDQAEYMPDWVKLAAKENVKLEWLLEAQNHQISKLRNLMMPRSGLRFEQ